MDQIKRKLSDNQSSEEKTKKLRNEIDQSITSIENFSNEFFYEIFDYLYGCDIFQSFSNLNHRFQQLLHSSSLLFKIKFHDSTSEEILLNNYQEIIRFNKNQIFSINIYLFKNTNRIISSLDIDPSFNRLESFTCYLIEPRMLTSLLLKLTHLPRFFSLTIDTRETLKDLTNVYQLIFDLPKLKYISFCAMGPAETDITVSLPIAINNQISTIKNLLIDHPCTFNELFSIISYTSEINRLHFIHKNGSTLKMETILPMILPNLTHLVIYGEDLAFDKLEIFISKLYSKLKVFSFTSAARDMIYLNADRWEELILKYLPQLEKFYLKYEVFFNIDEENPMYHGKSNQFTSSFWIGRKWVLASEIDYDIITYLIEPYKERWYEYDTQHKIINSPKELSKSMQITLTSFSADSDFDLLSEEIPHVLAVTQIYHLKICDKLVDGSLIDILLLLPKLDSLQILSLTLSSRQYLSVDELQFAYISKKNQITKVYLEKMFAIEEINFLIDICPHMMYLQVDFLNNMDIELFLRLISTKINTKSTSQLRLLCFRVVAADDKIIHKLNKMIISEKLLFDHTIKRILDKIYLQWK